MQPERLTPADHRAFTAMFMIPAGSVQLEAQLHEPIEAPRGAVVLCHPHPVYGGTMDNRVVYRAAKAAREAGYAALRFNFRGVGRSTGQFDQGLLDNVFRAVAKLPGVKLQGRGMPLEEPSDQFRPDRPARVGIWSFHHQ